MVAGIVHLVAPTAQIMPLKAFHADGTSRIFDIVRAIYYAVDHGARVINMSFSSTVSSPELARAIDYATNHGVVCVASAGNLGQEVVVYPGALRNVLGDRLDEFGDTAPVRSSFTNFGDALVSLAAPGEAVITTYPGGGYAGVWGTSFSTPLVAGGAALLLQIDPTLNQHKANEPVRQGHPDGAWHGQGPAESRSRPCGRCPMRPPPSVIDAHAGEWRRRSTGERADRRRPPLTTSRWQASSSCWTAASLGARIPSRPTSCRGRRPRHPTAITW